MDSLASTFLPLTHSTHVVGHTVKSMSEIKKSLNTGTIYIDGGYVGGGNLIAFDMDDHKIVYVANQDG